MTVCLLPHIPALPSRRIAPCECAGPGCPRILCHSLAAAPPIPWISDTPTLQPSVVRLPVVDLLHLHRVDVKTSRPRHPLPSSVSVGIFVYSLRYLRWLVCNKTDERKIKRHLKRSFKGDSSQIFMFFGTSHELFQWCSNFMGISKYFQLFFAGLILFLDFKNTAAKGTWTIVGGKNN